MPPIANSRIITLTESLKWRDPRRLLRSPYALLLLIFIASRAAYYQLGVRFDARGVDWFSQFLDPELLRHHLLQSLFYLHQQPPGYNLFLGVVLKLFPTTYGAAFHAIHLVFGAVIACFLFHLMRCLGVGVRLAFTATVLFIVYPGFVLRENFILYEYQMLFLLMGSAVFLFHFFERRSAASAIGFLVCQFWLVMVRNYFHMVYFAAIFVLLLYFTRHNRRLVAGVGSILVAVILGIYLKNFVVFGQFTSSTWLGMNMGFITYQLNPQERQFFASQGKLSRISTEMNLGVPLSAYRPYITMPAKTSIPALDQETKPSGSINYNHLGFLEVGKIYMKDGLFIIRHYPKVYVRSVVIAWFAYFLPTGDFSFFDLNLPRIRGIERFFDIVFFGQFKQASGKELRQLHAQGTGLLLVMYTGIFLLIGLPALVIFGTWFLYRGVRKRTLDTPQGVLLGFMLYNIAYITAVVNFLSTFENNRYRFPLDGYFVVIAALALDQIRRKFIRRALPATGR
jgi:hypothetical protein